MGPLNKRGRHVDTNQDYMNTDNRVVQMNQNATILGPWMINIWFLFLYISDDPEDHVTHYVTSAESKEMLTTQWYMQCIQFVCFWTFTRADWKGFY